MYDPGKTRNLLKMTGGYSNHPTGEFINELATQLLDADAEIAGAVAARTKAEGDANRYASELATLQTTVRQMRDENEALKNATPAPEPKKARAPRAVVLPPSVPPPLTLVSEPPVPPAAAPTVRRKKPQTPAA